MSVNGSRCQSFGSAATTSMCAISRMGFPPLPSPRQRTTSEAVSPERQQMDVGFREAGIAELLREVARHHGTWP
jgi:hypothetical protein